MDYRWYATLLYDFLVEYMEERYNIQPYVMVSLAWCKTLISMYTNMNWNHKIKRMQYNNENTVCKEAETVSNITYCCVLESW